MGTTEIRTERVYDEPSPDDGMRILVDRLWPRGMTHERADLDDWDRDVAPSTALREWWEHDPATFDEFAERYEAELDGSAALASLVVRIRSVPVVTLLFAAKDPAVNHAVVLRRVLERALA